VLKSAVLEAVRAAGKSTTFTVEFYPRMQGNVVDYTVTV
jgi:endoglucanase